MLASQSLSSTSSASFIRTKCSEIPRGPCIINYKQLKTIVLTAFSVLKGLGALESFSHSSMAVCHWATNSTAIVSSKLWKANIWSLCIGAASRILFINAEPYQTYRVSGWPEAWRWKNTLPNLIIFFQFQSPKWSSSVSCREPRPISFVLCAAGLILAHPRSGTSPLVLPMPFVRLNEYCKLHVLANEILEQERGPIWHCWIGLPLGGKSSSVPKGSCAIGMWCHRRWQGALWRWQIMSSEICSQSWGT